MYSFYIMSYVIITLILSINAEYMIFCLDSFDVMAYDCYKYNKLIEINLNVCQKAKIFCSNDILLCSYGFKIIKYSDKYCYFCYKTYCCNPNNTNITMNSKPIFEGQWWQYFLKNSFNNCTKFRFQDNNNNINFTSFLISNKKSLSRLNILPKLSNNSTGENIRMIFLATVSGIILFLFLYIFYKYNIPIYLIEKIKHSFQETLQNHF